MRKDNRAFRKNDVKSDIKNEAINFSLNTPTELLINNTQETLCKKPFGISTPVILNGGFPAKAQKLMSISVDWCSTQIEYSGEDLEGQRGDFYFEKLESHTRHYAEVYKIKRNEQPIAVLCCKPFSSVLAENSGILKFENKLLYRKDLHNYIKNIHMELNFTFKGYSRLDLAMDFISFDNDLNPATFIQEVASEKYLCRTKGEMKFNGRVSKKGNLWTGMTIGERTSDVYYQLYNKSLEMKKKKHKPWIAEQWTAAGWDGVSDVWRLEFRVKANKKAFVDLETGISIDLKNQDTIQWENVEHLYKMLFTKYFRFVHNNSQSRKDRMKPVVLLENINAQCVKIDLSSKTEGTRSDKIAIGYMIKKIEEIKGKDHKLSKYLSNYITYLLDTKDLWEWFKVRWPNYELHSSALRKIEERELLNSLTNN